MLMREPGRGGVGVRSWRSEKEVNDRYTFSTRGGSIENSISRSITNRIIFILNASAPNEKERCKSRITCMILFHPTNVTTCTKQTISQKLTTLCDAEAHSEARLTFGPH
jgi:hypothetical protein